MRVWDALGCRSVVTTRSCGGIRSCGAAVTRSWPSPLACPPGSWPTTQWLAVRGGSSSTLTRCRAGGAVVRGHGLQDVGASTDRELRDERGVGDRAHAGWWTCGSDVRRAGQHGGPGAEVSEQPVRPAEFVPRQWAVDGSSIRRHRLDSMNDGRVDDEVGRLATSSARSPGPTQQGAASCLMWRRSSVPLRRLMSTTCSVRDRQV